MDKFNDNLKQFIEIIKRNYPSQSAKIDEHYNFDNAGDKYINEFIENSKIIGNDISTKNEIIFSKGNSVLTNVDFYSIWNDEDLTEEQRDNIWKYLQTLYIFAYEYMKDSDFKTIMKELKKLGSNTENLDEDTKTFMNIIDSLTDKYNKEASGETTDDIEENDNEGGIPGIPTPDLFGGVIGNLAKEIAEEIDPSQLNLEDPSALLKNLLSGNFDENNDDSGITNLVKNITHKIQDKITSGDFDEGALFSEAQNVMKNFSNNKNLGGLDPMKMFNSMMNSGMMDGLKQKDQEFVNQAANIVNNPQSSGATPQSLKSQVDLRSRRDRLRKKLEEKKKKLQEKEQQQNINNSNYQENIDLDALAREIEGIGENKPNNKKNKNKK